jgi:hypothetical protein
MPEGVCSNADPSALELAQTYDYLGFVAMFAP